MRSHQTKYVGEKRAKKTGIPVFVLFQNMYDFLLRVLSSWSKQMITYDCDWFELTLLQSLIGPIPTILYLEGAPETTAGSQSAVSVVFHLYGDGTEVLGACMAFAVVFLEHSTNQVQYFLSTIFFKYSIFPTLFF